MTNILKDSNFSVTRKLHLLNSLTFDISALGVIVIIVVTGLRFWDVFADGKKSVRTTKNVNI